MIVRRGGAIYRRCAKGGCIFILVVVGIRDDNLALMTRLRSRSKIRDVEWERCGELTGLPFAGLIACSSESMSTSMGSLVGGVSLTLLSTSDDAEPPANWEGLDKTDLDTGVDAAPGFAGFSPGFPKKLMRLF